MMSIVGLRSTRRKEEKKERRRQFFRRIKESIGDRYEEFKLNREGKTKRKRVNVKARHRKVDRTLTALIIIVSLLLAITWVIVLFY